MADVWTLTGKTPSLLGGVPVISLKGWVQAAGGQQSTVNTVTGDHTLLRKSLDLSGDTWTIDLPATEDTDYMPPLGGWEVVYEGVDDTPMRSGKQRITETSHAFELTADTNFWEVVQADPVVVTETFVAGVYQARDDAEGARDGALSATAAAQGYRDESETLRDEQIDLSQIDTSDDVVEGLFKGTAGAGAKTRAASDARYGGPWKPATAYGLGATFTRPSDGLVRVVTTAYTSGSTYATGTDDTNSSSTGFYTLRSLDGAGQSAFATPFDVVDRPRRELNACDPRFAGGADPTGVRDSRPALYAWMKAMRNGADATGTTPTSENVAYSGYIPEGNYRYTPGPSGEGIEFVNSRNLQVTGGGSRNTVLQPDGTFTGDALAVINCQNSTLQDLKVQGINNATVADSGLAVDTIPSRGGTASSPINLHRVFVEGGSGWTFKDGFGLGAKTGTNDLAQVNAVECHSRGAYTVPTWDQADTAMDPTTFRSAWRLGGGGLGNVLNHRLTSCRGHSSRSSMMIDNVRNVSLDGYNSSDCGTYLRLEGSARIKLAVRNSRVEGSRRLLENLLVGTASTAILFENFLWGGNGNYAVTDRELIRWYSRGTLSMTNVELDASTWLASGQTIDDLAWKIVCGSTGIGSPQALLLDGVIAPNFDPASLISTPANGAVHVDVRGYDQTASISGTNYKRVRTHFTVNGAYGDDRRMTVLEKTNNYTLLGTDVGKRIDVNATGARTVTIPPSSSVKWTPGARFEVGQKGTGQVTLTPGAGVTINSLGGALKTSGQYAMVTLEYMGSDVWRAWGNLAV